MGQTVRRRGFLLILSAAMVTAVAVGIRGGKDGTGLSTDVSTPPVSVFEGVELVDEDPDGTRWRLRAESGSARELEVTGSLQAVRAEFERNGRRVTLQASSAEVDRGSQVELVGGVNVTWVDYSAQVDRATYLRGEGNIRSDARVVLRGPGFVVQGEGIEVDVEGRVARVLSAVHAALGGEQR